MEVIRHKVIIRHYLSFANGWINRGNQSNTHNFAKKYGEQVLDDVKISFVEFSYNQFPAYSTWYTPFEVNYGLNPLTPIDLIELRKGSEVHFEASTLAKEMRKIHEQVKEKIEHVNDLYKKMPKSIIKRFSLNLKN